MKRISVKDEDTLDGRGNVIRHVEYQAYLWDGSCGLEVVITGYVEYEVDEHERIVKATTYSGSGPDGQ